jgi:hypothetical protein
MPKTEKIKSDKIQLQKRIRAVQEWILQDFITTDIITNCINTWGVTERQAYRYLWAANRFFQERDKLSLDRKRAYYLARLKKLLRDMDPKEKTTAAGTTAIKSVLTAMAKLDGVNIETLKLIGDPTHPLRTIAEVAYTSASIDYSKLPTEFLKNLLSQRKAS